MPSTSRSRLAEDFNPRSREGSDDRRRGVDIFLYDFNPRSREGSDDHADLVNICSLNFNPRSREGSDSNFI